MKTYLIILLFAVHFNADGQNTEEQRNTIIALAVYQSFNDHNWEKMASYYDSQVIITDPDETEAIVGVTGMPDKYAAYAAHIPNIQDSVVNLYAFDHHVVVEFIAYGTTLDGEPFSLPICSIMTLENGKITREANYYDLKN